MVTCLGSLISTFLRSFTQYPCAIETPPYSGPALRRVSPHRAELLGESRVPGGRLATRARHGDCAKCNYLPLRGLGRELVSTTSKSRPFTPWRPWRSSLSQRDDGVPPMYQGAPLSARIIP